MGLFFKKKNDSKYCILYILKEYFFRVVLKITPENRQRIRYYIDTLKRLL